MKNSIQYTFLLFTLGLHLAISQEVTLEKYNFGEGFTLQSESGSKIKITGYFQPYFESKSYTDVDDTPDMNRFRMRRARLRFDGNSKNTRFSYRFQVDLSGSGEAEDEDGNTYLLDAFISYDLGKKIKLSFGQRAPYTDNRELFMNSNSLQLVERSRLTSAFATIREFGLFVDGTFRMGKTSYLKPYAMVTNGDGINVFSRDRGGLKMGGRLDFLPFGLFSNLGQFRQVDMVRELTPKLVIGTTYSYNNGISGRRGRSSGGIIYLNDSDEETLPDFSKFGVDFLFKYKGFSALGEFVKTNAFVPNDISKRVRNDGSVTSSFLVDGVQDIENYVKGRMMLGEAYNFQMGYLFKSGFSIDGRYTHLKADEHSFMNNGTFYNRPNYYTLGVGKYLSRNYGAKIQTDITYISNNGGINDNNGNPIEGEEWLARLILTLSF
jgi:hypothetical protein